MSDSPDIPEHILAAPARRTCERCSRSFTTNGRYRFLCIHCDPVTPTNPYLSKAEPPYRECILGCPSDCSDTIEPQLQRCTRSSAGPTCTCSEKNDLTPAWRHHKSCPCVHEAALGAQSSAEPIPCVVAGCAERATMWWVDDPVCRTHYESRLSPESAPEPARCIVCEESEEWGLCNTHGLAIERRNDDVLAIVAERDHLVSKLVPTLAVVASAREVTRLPDGHANTTVRVRRLRAAMEAYDA